jgi:hypothetical protein
MINKSDAEIKTLLDLIHMCNVKKSLGVKGVGNGKLLVKVCEVSFMWSE